MVFWFDTIIRNKFLNYVGNRPSELFEFFYVIFLYFFDGDGCGPARLEKARFQQINKLNPKFLQLKTYCKMFLMCDGTHVLVELSIFRQKATLDSLTPIFILRAENILFCCLIYLI